MNKMKTQSHHKLILKNTLLLNEKVKKVLRRMKVQIMIGLSKMTHSYNNKDHRLHGLGQYEQLYTWLYFNNALREYICEL